MTRFLLAVAILGVGSLIGAGGRVDASICSLLGIVGGFALGYAARAVTGD